MSSSTIVKESTQPPRVRERAILNLPPTTAFRFQSFLALDADILEDQMLEYR